MGSPEPPMTMRSEGASGIATSDGFAGRFRKRPHDHKAGYRVLAYPIAQTLREFQAVGHHAVRRTAGNVDPMSAAFHAVGRDCGGTTDTNDGNIFVGQFDGATVSPTRHHLRGFHGCDSARLLTEEIG